MPQPDDGVRPRIVFPDLVPGKEYTAEVNIIFPFNPDEPDLPQPQPITRVIQTLAMVRKLYEFVTSHIFIYTCWIKIPCKNEYF